MRPAVREQKKKYPRLWVSLCFYKPLSTSHFLLCKALWITNVYEMCYTNKLALPCLAYNRHTLGSYRGLISEIISGSLSPIRESEGRTPNVCLWCIFAIPKSEARSRSRGGVQHAQHESPVYDRRELTIKTCLHFRPVAVILNWVYLMGFYFILASK